MTQIWLDFKCFCGETACWLCWLSTLQDIRWKSVSAPLRNLSFCLWAPGSICTWPSLWLVGSVTANTVSACQTYHNIKLHWVVAVYYVKKMIVIMLVIIKKINSFIIIIIFFKYLAGFFFCDILEKVCLVSSFTCYYSNRHHIECIVKVSF